MPAASRRSAVLQAANETGELDDQAFATLVKVARRKLRYPDAAGDLGDLRSPPGNHLETLVGDRKGQHAIRVNDQFRVCFV